MTSQRHPPSLPVGAASVDGAADPCGAELGRQPTAASLQAQISRLKEAIVQISTTKKNLKQNVMEVSSAHGLEFLKSIIGCIKLMSDDQS